MIGRDRLIVCNGPFSCLLLPQAAPERGFEKSEGNGVFWESFIEKQAEDPLPLGGGMNAVPTAFETGAK
ncbi:MAG: hypothetical protein PHN61_14760 [Methanothrix sp.]|nr:hypothetical protein [Methanothrix sp.]